MNLVTETKQGYVYNTAQQILLAIGGTAAIVGGYNGNGWPDQQTPKAQRRAGAGKGVYGKVLRVWFDTKKALDKQSKEMTKS